jgi:hypothetical protein
VLGLVAQLVASLLLSLAGSAAAGTAAVGTAGVSPAAAAALLGRLMLWVGAAGLSWVVQQQLGHIEAKLLHGDYPPPRNTDRV